LNQAIALAPTDLFVETEWAHLLFKKSIATPASSASLKMVDEAFEILERLIASGGRSASTHVYHLLCSQGLAWGRRRKGIDSADEIRQLLLKLINHIKQGCIQHPADAELKSLKEALEREELMLAVN